MATEVWPAPTLGWRRMMPARPGYVALGMVVALVLPMLWGVAHEGRPGPAALLYSLPWGAGLAAVGWLRGRAAAVAGVTVVVSAVVCGAFAVSTHMMAYYARSPAGD